MVTETPAGAGSKALFVASRVPRERFTATVAPWRVCAVTPPVIIWSPCQPVTTSTSGGVVKAGEKVKVATPLEFVVAV
jgi:hypothetical protein